MMNIQPDQFAAPFARLSRSLKDAADGREIVFLQNPGNAGDALIHFGTVRFLEDAGLGYQALDMGEPADKLRAAALAATGSRSRLFVYGGSGAWSRACDLGRRNVRRLSWLTDQIFILPSTFEVFGLDRWHAAFRRDQLQSREAAPGAEFCHDMALYLALVSADRMLPGRRPPDLGVGYMFRTDNERRLARYAAMPGNLDLSAMGDHRADPQSFLRVLDRYRALVTDRLHVAIAGALLGKPVTLATGAYFKNEAIFRSSLEPYFPNVRLVLDDRELAEITAGAAERARLAG
jgi:exopolysaccharide biosynthesis predicted pyruvyltransferase EpsI